MCELSLLTASGLAVSVMTVHLHQKPNWIHTGAKMLHPVTEIKYFTAVTTDT